MPLEEIDANAEASSALGLSSLGVSIGKVSEKPNEDEDQEEVLIASNTDDRRTEEQEFDEIVGLLEDTLCDDAFQQLQDNFCLKHCDQFDEGEENKLCYTEIFTQYTHIIETFLEQRLMEQFQIPIESVASMIVKRSKDVTGDVIDMLLSFSDFGEFKGLMLSHKRNDQLPGIVTVTTLGSSP